MALRQSNTVTETVWGTQYQYVVYPIDVEINFSALVEYVSKSGYASNSTGSVTLKWYPDGTTAQTPYGSQTFTVSEGAPQAINITLPSLTKNPNANAYFEIMFNVASGTIAKLTSPKFNVRATVNSVNMSEATFTVSGANRETKTYPIDTNEKVFVKDGDTVRFQSRAAYTVNYDAIEENPPEPGTKPAVHSATSYFYPAFFLSAFGLSLNYKGETDGVPGVNPTVWENVSSQGKNFLTKKNGGEGVIPVTEGATTYGLCYVEYTVLRSGDFDATDRVINVTPTIYQKKTESGVTTQSLNLFKLYIDAGTPEAPRLDDTKSLGLTVKNGEWYTASNQVRIETRAPTFPSSFFVANEYVYAFVCPSTTVSVDFTGYEFKPNATDSTISVEGATVKRQQVVYYNLTGASPATSYPNLCDFERPGEYTLVLVGVDEAGNVSSPTVYSQFSENKSAKVDGMAHSLSMEFYLGSDYVGRDKMASISNVYILIGDAYHDSYGNLKDVIGTPGYYDARNSTTYYNPMTSNKTAKRSQWVTYSLAMSYNLQYLNYRLDSYQNGDRLSMQSPVFTQPAINRPYYRDITFQMDDQMILRESQVIQFLFRERVTVDVSLSSFPFTGSPRGLNAYVSSDIVRTGEEILGLTYSYKYYLTASDRDAGNDEYQYVQHIDVGTYYYKIEVDPRTTDRYFGERLGTMTILKTSPAVSGLVTKYPIVYNYMDETGIRGLDLVQYESLDRYGTVIPLTEAVTINGIKFYRTYYGVYGTFMITNPAKGTPEYGSPNANPSLKVSVQFTPIDVTKIPGTQDNVTFDFLDQNYLFYLNFYELNYDTLTFRLLEGGKTSKNYDVQTITNVVVVVNPARVVINPTGENTFVYDGTYKRLILSASLNGATLEGVSFRQTYSRYDPATHTWSSFSQSEPYNAGTYRVKYYVDPILSANYDSEPMTDEQSMLPQNILTITKRPLSVAYTGLPQTPVNPEVPVYVDGETGTEYAEYLEFVYGQFARPALYTSYTDSEGQHEMTPGYEYSYKLIRDLSGASIANPYYSEAVAYFGPDILGAGTFIFKISVRNENNSGSITFMIRVRAAINDNLTLKVTFPAADTRYEVYNVNDSVRRIIGGDSTPALLEYGMRLSDVADRLTMTLLTRAMYTYRGQAEATAIAGRFIFETEAEVAAREGITLTADGRLPVRLSGNQVISYPVRLKWQAGTYVDGIWVRNFNFEETFQSLNVYVARATASFSGVSLATLIYGKRLQDSSFVGNPTAAGGYIFDNSSATTYALVVNNPLSILPVGTHQVSCRFTPAGNLIYSYRDLLNVSIGITVTKETATVTFNSSECAYGKPASPSVATDPAGLTVVFTYFSGANQIVITSTTPVGVYTVRAEIQDENYEGTATADFHVVKAELRFYSESSRPTAPNSSYGTSLSQIPITPGLVVSENGIYYAGTFVFVTENPSDRTDVTGVPLTTIPAVGQAHYWIRFVPNESPVYTSYNILYYNLPITVNKATVNVQVSNLTQVYNGAGRAAAVTAVAPGGRQLSFTSQYGTLALGELPVNAGDYTATFIIADDSYAGSAVRTFTITKSPVTITAGYNIKTYNTFSQTVLYTLSTDINLQVPAPDLSGFTTVVYRNYANNVVTSQIDVGRYFASVAIEHQNFDGRATLTMDIKPASIVVNNLEQVYESFANVTADISPRDVSYSVRYTYKGSETVVASPRDAGQYDVKILIDYHGYTETVTAVNGTALVLTIAKLEIGINALPLYSAPYIAIARDLGITTTHGTAVRYSYKAAGSQDDYSEAPPITVGSYDVKVEVYDNNYKGTAYTVFNITPGDLVINDRPVILGSNYYSLSKELVRFSGGYVIFPARGTNVTSAGRWAINMTDDDFMLLDVGTYSVPLAFIPDDSLNFNRAYGMISISISKFDIGSFVRFPAAELVQKFDQRQHYVAPYLDNAAYKAVYGTDIVNISRIMLRVTYNGAASRPINVGSYEVSALIDDMNYAGSSAPATLVIGKAAPEIALPRLGDVLLGNLLSTSSITGGSAYIHKTDPNEQTRTIAGTFSYTVDYVMDKANYRPVWVTFTPTDEYNYEYVVFLADVFVIGQPVAITDISATPITYGQPLSASALSITASMPGSAAWANPNQIVNVGDSAAYVYTPNDIDNFNIVRGTYKLVVEKAQTADAGSSAKIYVGQRLDLSILDIRLYHGDHSGDPAWAVTGFTAAITSGPLDVLEGGATAFHLVGISEIESSFTLVVAVTHRNYETAILNVQVTPYVKVEAASFLVGSSSKYFDGREASIGDFGIALADTSYVVNGFYISNIIYENQKVGSILYPGAYAVTVGILRAEGEIYDGEATFTYNVFKRDVSGGIKLANGESQVVRTYADRDSDIALEFYEIVNGVRVNYNLAYSDLVFEYLSGDGLTSIGPVSPRNAGSYKVKISVNSANNSYTGFAIYNYVVNKKSAVIALRTSYSFTFGDLINIVPEINVSGLAYSLTYDGKEQAPQNAGVYSVVAHVNHPNFVGDSAPAELIISKAPVRIALNPSVSNLIYGVELRSAVIMGGLAVFGTAATAVEGTFTFVYPEKHDYPVGVSNVDMKFTPTDPNYAEVQFVVPMTIIKAAASIEVRSMRAVYTGSRLLPDIITQPDASLLQYVDYIFTQNGYSVEPINAGDYEVTMRIISDNYEGSLTRMFTIVRAAAISVVEPTPTSVQYGQSLGFSALLGGQAFYVQGSNIPASGTFAYITSGQNVLGDAGRSYTVEYAFYPTDAANLEPYYGEVDVTVVKAPAKITATNINFVYGDLLTNPVFITEPKDLNVPNNEFVYSELKSGTDNQKAGTYQFKAVIEDQNYVGEIDYIITISKKQAVVKFYNEGGGVVDRYTTQYKSPILVKAQIQTNSLALRDRDLMLKAEIEKNLYYVYTPKSAPGTKVWNIQPEAVGEYIVYVTLTHSDYYLDNALSEVDYIVNRGTVTRLDFDLASLNTQVYGSVAEPKVLVSPNDVKYTIYYTTYTCPTDAGTYRIRVAVTDDNYLTVEKESTFRILPKDVTVENIKLFDKAFDGLSEIRITGELKGVMIGDEVSLTLAAKASGGATAPGVYRVEIYKYEINGLHASNYNLLEPLTQKTVRISVKTITDPETGSYISSADGFSSNITVTFEEVYDSQNKTGFFSSLIGQKAIVRNVIVKENGIETVLGNKVKFYVKIPDEYLAKKNLTFGVLGDLAKSNILPIREGDYVTFYADRSGEVVIYANDFPYWTIILAGVILVIGLGYLLVRFASPARRRRKVSRGVRQTYVKLSRRELKLAKRER